MTNRVMGERVGGGGGGDMDEWLGRDGRFSYVLLSRALTARDKCINGSQSSSYKRIRT